MKAEGCQNDQRKSTDQIEALLALHERGTLVPHSVGDHGRELLERSAKALAEFETFKVDRFKESEEILEASAAHSKKVDALQDLLNERDQRLDELMRLLRRAIHAYENGYLKDHHEAMVDASAYLAEHEPKEHV